MAIKKGGLFFGIENCFCKCCCDCKKRRVYGWTQPYSETSTPHQFPSGIVCSKDYCGCYKAQIIVTDPGYGTFIETEKLIKTKCIDNKNVCCIDGLENGYFTSYLYAKNYSVTLQIWVMCKCTPDGKYLETVNNSDIPDIRTITWNGPVVKTTEPCK
jgi:hypothetical protein